LKKLQNFFDAMVGGFYICSIIVVLILLPDEIYMQENQIPEYGRNRLIGAAREVMASVRYCALITLDQTGHPQARTMDPFLPDENMVVWFGTNLNSRKVNEIRRDSRATLYYEAPGGTGYVVIKGEASLIDDPEKKSKYWKTEWEKFYPNKKETYVLIQVIPVELEIISYDHNIVGDPKSWEVPRVEFKTNK
jgi:general stress protein 26